MIESLLPLKIPPGMYKNGTRTQAAGRWYDGDRVRFFENTIRPIGGWRAAQDPNGNALIAVAGRPSRIYAYRGDDGQYRIGIGTHTGLFMLKGSVITDITPVGFTAGNATGYYSPGNATTGDAPLMATLYNPDAWSLDNFGNYLVGVMGNDGHVQVWQNDSNPAAPAAGAPTGVRGVVVTPEGYLFALGISGNPRMVSWPSQQTFTDWTATANNTAGDFPLNTSGNLMCGRRTSTSTLLFTDTDLWLASFVGEPDLYSFTQAGDACGIIGANAVAMVGNVAFWMGHNRFFTYDGFVKEIPSDVGDYVFSDFNAAQRAKTWARTNTQFGEVTWHYCSSASTECDRYVTYNYIEGHWSVGTMDRTAGIDAGVTPFPLLTDATGHLYEHEYQHTMDATTPFLSSGPVVLADGSRVMKIQRIIPDDKTVGDVSASLDGSMFPDGAETSYGPYTLSAKTDVRITARLVRVGLTQVRATDWRVGTLVLGVVPGGAR